MLRGKHLNQKSESLYNVNLINPVKIELGSVNRKPRQLEDLSS